MLVCKGNKADRRGIRRMEKIQTGLRLPKEQYEKLRSLADRLGASLNSVAAQAIEIGLIRMNKDYEVEDKEPCSFS